MGGSRGYKARVCQWARASLLARAERALLLLRRNAECWPHPRTSAEPAMFVFEKAKGDVQSKKQNEKLATFAMQAAIIAGALAALRAT